MRQLTISVQLTDRRYVSLEKYFQEIAREAMITPDEEAVLARRIREGDQVALERLTKANLRFVVSVAKQYHRGGNPITLGDLISEGNLGLIRAAQKFDETRGFKFISYAVWWIRQSIIQSLSQHSRVVRLPSNRVNNMSKIYRSSTELEQQLNREPTDEELAEIMDLTPEEIVTNRSISKGHVSINVPLGTESENNLLDVLSDNEANSPEDVLITRSLQIELDRVLAKLSVREREILSRFYGLHGEPPQRLSDISDRMGLTMERVRQIKEKAIEKLNQKTLTNDRLRSFLG